MFEAESLWGSEVRPQLEAFFKLRSELVWAIELRYVHEQQTTESNSIMTAGLTRNPTGFNTDTAEAHVTDSPRTGRN